MIAPSRRGFRDRAVPVELESVCLKALEKDPAQRYQTAEAFAAEDEHSLRRALGALNLTTLGIGAIVALARIVSMALMPVPAPPPMMSRSNGSRCNRSIVSRRVRCDSSIMVATFPDS